MNRIFLILLLSTISRFTYAQEADFDSHMTKHQTFKCEDVAMNSSIMFVDYIARSEVDSAKMILSYWESKCTYSEAIFRANTLLAIQEDCYNDSIIRRVDVVSQIINFKARIALEQSDNPAYYFAQQPQLYSYLPPGCEFDLFTNTWATSLVAKQPFESIEYLWCELFTGKTNRLVSELNKRKTEESPNLIEPVKQSVKYANGGYGTNVAFIAGMWVPTGGASILGVHPEVGFQAGVRIYDRFMIDLTMLMRFLKSKYPYYAMREDGTLEQTKEFLGGYIGLDLGYVLLKKKAHELDALTGIAFDGFDCLNEDKELNLKSRSVSSYNVNVGLGYKYFFKEGTYVGLNAKYNIVDYKRSKVIDFTGNTVTLDFLIGGLSFNQNRKGLKAWLDY